MPRGHRSQRRSMAGHMCHWTRFTLHVFRHTREWHTAMVLSARVASFHSTVPFADSLRINFGSPTESPIDSHHFHPSVSHHPHRRSHHLHRSHYGHQHLLTPTGATATGATTTIGALSGHCLSHQQRPLNVLSDERLLTGGGSVGASAVHSVSTHHCHTRALSSATECLGTHRARTNTSAHFRE